MVTRYVWTPGVAAAPGLARGEPLARLPEDRLPREVLRRLRSLLATLRDRDLHLLGLAPACTLHAQRQDALPLARLGLDERGCERRKRPVLELSRRPDDDVSHLQAGLLSGPPGCGKTQFAIALGRTTGLPVLAGSLGQWQAAREA